MAAPSASVAICVVEMPVRIDQVRDWPATKAVGGFQDSQARRGDTSIDDTLPSAPVKTAMLPPEPSRALTLPRSLWTLIGTSAD
jgi:hypothetical protein